MWLCADTSTCSPLPSSGYRGRPLREPCGSPPSQVVWVRKTARLSVAAASGLPWQQVSARRGFVRFPRGEPSSPETWSCWGWAKTDAHIRTETGSSPRFTGSPFGCMPRPSTPATLGQPRMTAVQVLPSAPATASTSLCLRFRSSILAACILAVYASTAVSRPTTGNTRYRPARYGFDRAGLAPAGLQ